MESFVPIISLTTSIVKNFDQYFSQDNRCLRISKGRSLTPSFITNIQIQIHHEVLHILSGQREMKMFKISSRWESVKNPNSSWHLVQTQTLTIPLKDNYDSLMLNISWRKAPLLQERKYVLNPYKDSYMDRKWYL